MNPSSLRASLLCLSLLALAACGGKEKQQKPPPPEVGVIHVQPQNAPLTKDLVARLSAYRSADVRARVSGVLLKRTYEEGSQVKKGQLLFQIDPAPLRATLSSAQATLASAKATATNNRVAADRYRSLAPKGYVSKSDLDNAEAAQRSSAAAVKQGQADVQSARINLDYASVQSPIDGVAGQQQVTEGALVSASNGTLLTTVDQLDPLYVNFTLNAEDRDQMRHAQREGSVTLAEQNMSTVTVTLSDGSVYDHEGVLDFSSERVNPDTGSVTLRAKIPNPEHELLPGQYVTIEADLGEQHNIYKVPQQALQRDTSGAYVLVVGKDNKVKRESVQTVSQQGTNWIVNKGLHQNDQIIVSGVQKAKEGQPAQPKPWQPNRPDAGNKGEAAKAGSSAASAGGASAAAPGRAGSEGQTGQNPNDDDQ